MVQWYGKLEGDVGERARNLERLEDLKVPNFFVITSEETSRLFDGSSDPEKVLNKSLDSGMKSEIKDAYGEIGMSSEVRTADGKAKDLVGGQRNDQLVSVRISGSEKGMYDYRLNVGSSNLMEAIKEVAVSYYRVHDEHPSIIVQKMVEAEHSGALIENYLGRFGLLEVVEGLGTSLEEGISQPHLYLLNDRGLVDSRKAEKQIKLTRNPINGKEKRKQLNVSSPPLNESEVEELYEKVSRNGYSVKFAYKRNSFYITDAWKLEDDRNDRTVRQSRGNDSPDLDAVRVSEGKIRGRAGREVSFTDQPVAPEEYQQALISRKGGYTSENAQKARRTGKPALFGFDGSLEEGQQVVVEEGSSEISEDDTEPDTNPFSSNEVIEDNKEHDNGIGHVTAAEVLPLDPRKGRGLHLSPPFGPGYIVTSREVRGGEKLPESGYIDDYSDFFRFEGEKAVVDAGQLERDGLEEAISYLEADFKAIIMKSPDENLIREAVKTGFKVFSAPERDLDALREKVLEAEKRFIMDRLRKL